MTLAARYRVDTYTMMNAVSLGKHLEEADRCVRWMSADKGAASNVLDNLARLKRALRAAVRDVETLEFSVRNPSPQLEDEA
jgi:hypothetical protein